LEVGGNNYESETKLIFDKRWKNDLLAFNIVGKYEIEKEVKREDSITKAEWTSSSPVEFYSGYIHFFKPKVGLGLEHRNNNDIIQKDGWMNSVLFLGPAVFASTYSRSQETTKPDTARACNKMWNNQKLYLTN